MNQVEVEEFVSGLDHVQRAEEFGYVFFFVGDDHRVPFVSIADSDNDFDNVSNLSRAGVFRVNIGVGKATYKTLIGQPASEIIDYSVLDVLLPHPHYSRHHFVCILSPSSKNDEVIKKLIEEAYSIAASRLKRKQAK